MLSSRGERGGGDRFEEEAARQGSLVLDGKEILERLVKGRWS